jgi:hypothetical protein
LPFVRHASLYAAGSHDQIDRAQREIAPYNGCILMRSGETALQKVKRTSASMLAYPLIPQLGLRLNHSRIYAAHCLSDCSSTVVAVSSSAFS